MADLSDRGRRGQILLVTGFALAVAFVALALVLNSVIYTENLATRSESTTSDPVSHARTLERGTADVLEYVNEHNTSLAATYAGLGANLSRGIANITDIATRHQLAEGQVTADSLLRDFDGTWLRQTNASRNFTNRNLATEWSPVNASAGGARSLRIFVADTGVLTTGSSRFEVSASDGTDNWRLQIGSTSVTVTDAAGTTTSTATPALGSFWVNVSAGTLAGSEFAALDFGDDLGTIQSIEFENARNIEGTYRLMVNRSRSNVDTAGVDYAPDTTGPFTERALYGAVVGVDYERRNLVYKTDLRVIPGERDD